MRSAATGQRFIANYETVTSLVGAAGAPWSADRTGWGASGTSRMAWYVATCSGYVGARGPVRKRNERGRGAAPAARRYGDQDTKCGVKMKNQIITSRRDRDRMWDDKY